MIFSRFLFIYLINKILKIIVKTKLMAKIIAKIDAISKISLEIKIYQINAKKLLFLI